MNINKRATALFLSLLMVLTSIFIPGSSIKAEAVSQNDFDVNTDWVFSNEDIVTSEYTAVETKEGGFDAYKKATSNIGDVGVTSTFTPTAGRPDGVSYLSNNGINQAAYGARPGMFYGDPTPASIPALGIDAQPGSVITPQNTYASYTKMNMNGQPAEEGILTFTFDKEVTDPVLDLSGLGGFVTAGATYYKNNVGPYFASRASFNSTDLELLTNGITLEKVASNSNLIIKDSKIIRVDKRNTHTRAEVDPDQPYNITSYRDDYSGKVFTARGPNLEPAGTGSVILRGTFDKVSFKLYHVATPYSAFSTEDYGTGEIYSWNSSWGPQFGDGVNGLNILNSEYYNIGYSTFNGTNQNLDLFRASLRLPKLSSIGDKVWVDASGNGIQDEGENGLAGVKVELLDANGQPAKDFYGNNVGPQVTGEDGTYKFDRLAAGNYKVKFTKPDGSEYKFTQQVSGNDVNSDAGIDGTTDEFILGVKEDKTNVDAGFVIPASISGKAWVDDNSNGIQDPNEIKVPEGTKAKLTDSNGNAVKDLDGNDVSEVTVKKDGTYQFTNLLPGDYRVVFIVPEGAKITQKDAGTDDAKDSDADKLSGQTDIIRLQSGEHRENIDIGVWPKEYIVTHEFKSGTPGIELPDEVRNLRPENQTGKYDGETVTPTTPTENTVETDEGTWVFEAYDEESKTIDGADQKFVGTWTLRPKQYRVTYEFKSGTEGVELPKAVKVFLPEDQTGKHDGDTVKPAVPEKKTFETDEGTWEFKGYQENGEEVTSKTIDKADQNFVGIWEFTPKLEAPQTYKVTHEFVSGTQGFELPKAIKDLLPDDQVGKRNGDKVSPTDPVQKEYKIEGEGAWIFEGYKDYDENSQPTIDNADYNFVGVWRFAPLTYKVTHEFISGTKGKVLPDNVIALLPEDQTNKNDGEKVTPSNPKDNVKSVEDTLNDGIWDFKGYQENGEEVTSKTIDKADQNFVGIWEFTPNNYAVTYTFQSITEGKELPGKIANAVPGKLENLIDRERVTSTSPTTTEYKVKGGKWVFEGYDKDFIIIDKDAGQEGRNFEGRWRFIPNPASISGKVWIDADKDGIRSVSETQVPENLIARLTDIDGNAVKDLDGSDIEDILIGEDGAYRFENLPAGNYKVIFKAPSGTDFTIKYQGLADTDSNVNSDGKTDPIELQAGGNEENIDAGVLPKEYKVMYTFVSRTPGKILPKNVLDLLPADQEGKGNGVTVEPTTPIPTRVESDKGTWIFKGYDSLSIKISNDDAHFIGTWEFEEKDPVVLSSIGDTVWKDTNNNGIQDDGEEGLAGVIVRLLDINSNPIKDVTGSPIADQTTDKYGKYKFDNLMSGDYIVQVIAGENQGITKKTQGDNRAKDSDVDPVSGKTEVITLTENDHRTDIDAGIVDLYKVTYDFKSGTEDKDLPQEVIRLLPEDNKKYTNGTRVTAERPKFDMVKVDDGTWRFEGYDKKSGKIDNADEHFIGTWTFTPNNTEEPTTDKGSVDVKYITTDGKVLEGPTNVKKDAPVGEAYTTEQKTFDGYEFVKMGETSADASGKVTKGDQHVIYVYKPVEPTTDKGSVDVKYITTDGKVLEGPTSVKQDAPAGEAYTTGAKNFEGYEYVKLADDSAAPTGTVKAGETQHVIYVYEKTEPTPKTGNVYVKYIAEDGTVLEEESAVKENAPVGEAYATEQKAFEGYKFVRMEDGSAERIGTVTEEDQYVVYVYEKIPENAETGSVYVKYVTEDGDVLEAESAVKENAPVGDDYTTEQKAFDGYEFVEMKEGSASAEGKVKVEDQHVVYVYKRVKFNVTHTFKSSDPNRVLPEEVKALLPEDQTGKNGTTVTPTQPTSTTVTTPDGTWTFKGYDKDRETVNGANVNFVGTWDFTPNKETGSVDVKYVTTDGTVIEGPTSVKQDAPAGEAYMTGAKNFEGYEYVKLADDSAPSVGTVKAGETQHVIYVYKPVEPTTDKGSVDVKYITTNGKVLEGPTSVKKDASVGEGYTTEQKTFEGYKFKEMQAGSAPANGTVKKGDQHVVYVYEKVEPTTETGNVDVTYITEGGKVIEGPTSIKKDAPIGESYTTRKKTFDGYEFVRMDRDSAPANGTVKKGDQHVVYVYKAVTPVEEGYKVTYEFKSGTPGKSLPKQVTDLLPSDQSGKKNGEKVTPIQPTDKTVKVPDGVWTFEGYDPTSQTIDKKDAKFVGTWKFTPNQETGNVDVKYVTEDGKVLEGPTNVKKDKPTGEKYTTDLKKFKGYQFVKLEDGSAPANGEVKKGDQHVVYVYREITPDTKTGSVYVEYVTEDGEILEGPTDVKKDAPLGEKYTTEKKAFDGYEFVEMKDDSDPATGTVKAEDQHVIYVYKKKADNKEDEYKVIHEFESGTEGKKLPKEIMDLLPPAQLHKKNGEKVTPTNPSKMKIKTADGTWEFKGYDKADKTIDGADAKFVGKWVFTPNSAKPTDANSKNDGKGTPGKNLGGSTAKGDLSGKNLPKTGDGLDPSFYVMLLLVAGAGLTALGMKERRKMKNKF